LAQVTENVFPALAGLDRMCGPVVLQQDVQDVPTNARMEPANFKHHDEDELIRQVPGLLERMNDAAEATNRLEFELSQAQAKHKVALSEWTRLYDELRARHGSLSGAIDHAKPYFEALRECQAATRRAQQVRQLQRRRRQQLKAVEDAGQSGLLREELRSCDQEFELASQELSRTRAALAAQRKKVGAATIENARPCFGSPSRQALAQAQEAVAQVAERIAAAKADYKESLMELNRISDAVHAARSQWNFA